MASSHLYLCFFMLIVTLLAVSLIVLVLTFIIWRETSSRPSLFNGIFASLTLLISARLTAEAQQVEMAVGLPLLAGMLLLGRGVGTLIRSRKEPVLRRIAIYLIVAATASLGCTVAVYFHLTRG